jgi:hypothetical protein
MVHVPLDRLNAGSLYGTPKGIRTKALSIPGSGMEEPLTCTGITLFAIAIRARAGGEAVACKPGTAGKRR